MSYNIVDRRPNGKNKSSVNRGKFLKRVRSTIKKSVDKMIADGSVKDLVEGKEKNINVPVKDISEPNFRHDKGGSNDRVFPGNKEFQTGDRIPRPPAGEGSGGSEGSPDGEGLDEFVFSINREEFLEYFFKDMELPDLVQKQLSLIEETRQVRSGYSTDGIPARLDILKSMSQSVGRRAALRNPKKRKIKELETELEQLNVTIANMQANSQDCTIEKDRKQVIEDRLVVLKRQLAAISYVEETDLRYRQFVQETVPIHKAVMFCVMDVSGSMTENMKELAKRFYMMLYLFLYRNYEHIDIRYIRHTTSAREVTEEEFFYSRESGGTIVSSALKLTAELIKEHYPLNEWNVYVAQTTDGDNWTDDNHIARELLVNEILPMVQYYFYIEIASEWRGGMPSDMIGLMEDLKSSQNNIDIGFLANPSDIYPVFKGLFEKRTA